GPDDGPAAGGSAAVPAAQGRTTGRNRRHGCHGRRSRRTGLRGVGGGRQVNTLLEFDNVTMRFGGVTALREVNISINEGEIFALIGPNGAGKTTVFNVVTGVY